jgi:hypothetical protein
MTRVASIFAIAVVGIGLASCWEPNENIYCDGKQWFCNDPAYPYCNGNRCEAAPGDMNVVDAGVDAAPTCTMSSMCAETAPICENNTCRPCAGPSDDAECLLRSSTTPVCVAGACVRCRDNAHCSGTTPVCGTDHTCRPCTSHGDCTSLVCNADGSCADAATVAYVDNKNGSCTGTHTGTQSDAYCQIQDAINAPSPKPTIRVLGSTMAYARIEITSGTFTIIGPGQKGVAPSAKISAVTNPPVTISGATATLTLDGFEITGGSAGIDGISCSHTTGTGPSLTVRRSFIHDMAGGAGINGSRCRLTVERSQIGPGNTGGGLSLTNTQYSIFNSFIIGNASTGSPAITFGGGSTELSGGFGFSHNTVANNTRITGVAGIACNAGMPTEIKNSIVVSNTPTNTGGSDGCTMTNSVTSMTPDFVDSITPTTFDFHLAGRTANNTACCIDKITSTSVTADYDGRARPQPAGGMSDIGAHEVQ